MSVVEPVYRKGLYYIGKKQSKGEIYQEGWKDHRAL